jgi:hypothetical protein
MFNEQLSPADEINESLGYDADVTDSSQYCKHGTFIGSWWGPDYLCGACEDGLDTLKTATRWRSVVYVTCGDHTPDKPYRGSSVKRFGPRVIKQEIAAWTFGDVLPPTVSTGRDDHGRYVIIKDSLSRLYVKVRCERYSYWDSDD